MLKVAFLHSEYKPQYANYGLELRGSSEKWINPGTAWITFDGVLVLIYSPQDREEALKIVETYNEIRNSPLVKALS